MSAQLDTAPVVRPMRATDLDAVVAVEEVVYPFPWTRGNFGDSIKAGYHCRVCEVAGELVAYGVMMIGADEAHLLNLSVAAEWQRQGLGRFLLHHFVRIARDCRAGMMYLEVRPTNTAARTLYESEGFHEIALRRNYYPAENGREHAVVMGLTL
ncbi:MAG: ribosomal protein S18-alanine N-acetyltransferase [Betaproteobacteria bacterium]|nr:ribosomal protein S18-alanine N-acetyltransferase [Betaproteobacteria bacterium]